MHAPPDLSGRVGCKAAPPKLQNGTQPWVTPYISCGDIFRQFIGAAKKHETKAE